MVSPPLILQQGSAGRITSGDQGWTRKSYVEGGQPLTARDAVGQGSEDREPPCTPLPSPALPPQAPVCSPAITPAPPPLPSTISLFSLHGFLEPVPSANSFKLFFLNHEILPSTCIFQDKGRLTVRTKPCDLGEKKGS